MEPKQFLRTSQLIPQFPVSLHSVQWQPQSLHQRCNLFRSNICCISIFFIKQCRVISIDAEEPVQPIQGKDQDFKSAFGESDRISMMEDKNQWDNNQSQADNKSRSGKRCFNVKCNSTKNIRKVKSKVVPSKYRNICQACYQNYLNSQFCEFCQQIYGNNDTDDNDWMGCDQCDRWNHVSCQYQKRDKKAYTIKQDGSQYFCLQCTSAKKDKTQTKRQKTNTNNNEDYYEYQKRRNTKRTARQSQPQDKHDEYSNSNPNFMNVFNRPKQTVMYLDAFLHSINNYKLGISDFQIREDFKKMKDSTK